MLMADDKATKTPEQPVTDSGVGVAAESTVLFCNVRTYGQYIYTQGTGQIDYYFIYDENQERNIEQYLNLPV